MVIRAQEMTFTRRIRVWIAHGLRACVMRSSVRECNASIDVRACCAGSRTRSAFAPERTFAYACTRVHASARLNVGADITGLPERSRMREPSSRSGGEATRASALLSPGLEKRSRECARVG